MPLTGEKAKIQSPVGPFHTHIDATLPTEHPAVNLKNFSPGERFVGSQSEILAQGLAFAD